MTDRLRALVRDLTSKQAASEAALSRLQAEPTWCAAVKELERVSQSVLNLHADTVIANRSTKRINLTSSTKHLRHALSGKPLVLSKVEEDTLKSYWRKLVRRAHPDTASGPTEFTVQDLKNAVATANLPQMHLWAMDVGEEIHDAQQPVAAAQRALDLYQVSPMFQITVAVMTQTWPVAVERAVAAVQGVTAALESSLRNPS